MAGTLPAGGTKTVIAGNLPAAAADLEVVFQTAVKRPTAGDGLHWTKLERLNIFP